MFAKNNFFIKILIAIPIGIAIGFLDFIINGSYRSFKGIKFDLSDFWGYLFFICPTWMLISVISFLLLNSVSKKFEKNLMLLTIIIPIICIAIPFLFLNTKYYLDFSENVSKIISFLFTIVISLKISRLINENEMKL